MRGNQGLPHTSACCLSANGIKLAHLFATTRMLPEMEVAGILPQLQRSSLLASGTSMVCHVVQLHQL